MYYLNLRQKLFSGGKENKIKLDKKTAESLIRDAVANNLYMIITNEKNDNKNGMNPAPTKAKVFSLDDHKQLHKFKEKVLYSDDDIVALSDNLFKFIDASFKPEIFDASLNDIVVNIAEMLDECKNPKSEEEVEKAYKEYCENKGEPYTIEKFYKEIGIEVEIIEDKKGE